MNGGTGNSAKSVGSVSFRLLLEKIAASFGPFNFLDSIMKADLHPIYKEAVIQCNCGNVIQTRSTVSNLHVGICSACHPFFTGEQRFVDTAGRVDKFQKRFGDAKSASERRKKPKLSDLSA